MLESLFALSSHHLSSHTSLFNPVPFLSCQQPTDHRPLFRDSMWYMVCLAALVICFGVSTPDYITLGEGLIMFSLYILYVLLCMYSETLRLKAAKCFSVFAVSAHDTDDLKDGIEMKELSKEDAKKDRKYKKNLHRNGSIFTGMACRNELGIGLTLLQPPPVYPGSSRAWIGGCHGHPSAMDCAAPRQCSLSLCRNPSLSSV